MEITSNKAITENTIIKDVKKANANVITTENKADLTTQQDPKVKEPKKKETNLYSQISDDKEHLKNPKIVDSPKDDSFLDDFLGKENISDVKNFTEDSTIKLNEGLDTMMDHSRQIKDVTSDLEKLTGQIAKPLKTIETVLRPFQLIPVVGDVVEVVCGAAKTVDGAYKAVKGIRQGAEFIEKGSALLKNFINGFDKFSHDLDANLKKYSDYADKVFKGEGGIEEGINLLQNSFGELEQYGKDLDLSADNLKKTIDVALLGAGSAINTVEGTKDIAFGIEKTVAGVNQCIQKLNLLIGGTKAATLVVI